VAVTGIVDQLELERVTGALRRGAAVTGGAALRWVGDAAGADDEAAGAPVDGAPSPSTGT
jgi:hypothetical protein